MMENIVKYVFPVTYAKNHDKVAPIPFVAISSNCGAFIIPSAINPNIKQAIPNTMNNLLILNFLSLKKK